MFMPFHVLGMWTRNLFALVFIGLGIYLLCYWYNHRDSVITHQQEIPRSQELAPDGSTTVVTTQERVSTWHFGLNLETAILVGGILCLLWSMGGGWIFVPRLFRHVGKDEPVADNSGRIETLLLSDGSELRIESTGPPDAEPLILTHGWSLNKDEWCYAKRQLGGRFRVITWDLPGLGQSSRPPDKDWSLEKLARALEAVIARTPGKPVTLIGHSIGVMVILTYCKLFPASLGTSVKALVLGHGTYTNPVKTTKGAAIYTALQKPLIEPLCHVMIWLSPLVRVMNWIGYLNGSMHRSTERVSFSGGETRGQLDFLTWNFCKAAPDVVARGMLGMLRYDATDTLPHINVPTLVVEGDKDETCLPTASQFMAAQIPGAQLLTLAQSKHCGLFEHPEQFHKAIEEFLTKVETGMPPERPFSAAGTGALAGH